MRLTEGTIVDRYTVEAVLGQGGMAVVYRVRHNQLGSLHAMKVLKLPAAAIQERLLQEGRVQAQLNHPNIVSVTDVVDVHGSPGLVMEFIQGSSLDQFLRDRRLTLDQANDLGRGIIEGVAVAHLAGLIHRDLKPANILLGTSPTGVVPKITDFGLAKMLQGDASGHLATRTGMSMGTPSYMAPEQIESARDVDQRADVFSLGAILYELLTGERPFQGPSTLAVLNAVAAGRRQPLEERMPGLPAHFIRAVDGALVVDLEERVPTCDALLDLWTGQERDAKGGFSGVWDGDTVTRISRAVAPVDPSNHSDASETYFPTQGVGEASALEPDEPTRTDLQAASDDEDSGLPRGLQLGGLVLLGVVVLSIGGWRVLGRSPPEPIHAGVTEQAVSPSGDAELDAAPDPIAVPDPTAEPPPIPADDAPDPAPVPTPAPGPVTPEEAGPAAGDDDEEEEESEEDDERSDLPLLTFLSDPDGATVFVDELEVGVTPLVDFAVPKGRHRVRMTLGDASMEERFGVSRRSARTYHWTIATGSFSER